MMPAGDMPYTPPRCPLGVVVFAFQRHRMNRRDRKPNPGFLPTATQGEGPSVGVRLVWELRVLRGAHATRKRSRRYSLKPSANGFLEWVPVPVHKAVMRTGHRGTVSLLQAHGRHPLSDLCAPLGAHSSTPAEQEVRDRTYEVDEGHRRPQALVTPDLLLWPPPDVRQGGYKQRDLDRPGEHDAPPLPTAEFAPAFVRHDSTPSKGSRVSGRVKLPYPGTLVLISMDHHASQSRSESALAGSSTYGASNT